MNEQEVKEAIDQALSNLSIEIRLDKFKDIEVKLFNGDELLSCDDVVIDSDTLKDCD